MYLRLRNSGGSRGGARGACPHPHPLILGKERLGKKSQKEEKPEGQAKENRP